MDCLYDKRRKVAAEFIKNKDIEEINRQTRTVTDDPRLQINKKMTLLIQNKLKETGDKRLEELVDHGIVFNSKGDEDSILAYQFYHSPILAMRADGMLVGNLAILPYESNLVYTDKKAYDVSRVKKYDPDLSKLFIKFDSESKRNSIVNWDKLTYRMFKFERLTHSKFYYEFHTLNLEFVLESFEDDNELDGLPDGDVEAFLNITDKAGEYIGNIIKEKYNPVNLIPNYNQIRVCEIGSGDQLYSNLAAIGNQLESIIYVFNK